MVETLSSLSRNLCVFFMITIWMVIMNLSIIARNDLVMAG